MGTVIRVAAIAVLAAAAAAPAAALGADAWPMPGHDAARTSRSAAVSAQAAIVLPGWPVMAPLGGPVVAPNGRVELPLAGVRAARLNRDGTFGEILPGGGLIGTSGRRYAIDARGRVSAFTSSGARLWRSAPVDLGGPVVVRPVPPVSKAAVYALGPAGVAAFDAAGGLRWRIEGLRGDTPGGVAVGSDGTAYASFGSFLESNRVVAVRPDGSVLWVFPLDGAPRDVVVAGDGTVLVGEQARGVDGATTLWAIGADGAARWVVPGAGTRRRSRATGPCTR